MKKVAATIGLTLIFAGTAPVVPQDMKLVACFQGSYSGQFATEEYIYQASSSTPAEIRTRPALSRKPWNDVDGNNLVSWCSFKDSNANERLVQIPDEQYADMGKKKGFVAGKPTGFNANPTKDEYLTLFQSMTPDAEAAIGFNASSSIKTVESVSSITYAHDAGSGSNRFLAVTHSWNDNGTGDISTVSATFNADDMTLITGAECGNDLVELYLYGLANPDSGSNNVVVTRSVTVVTQYNSFAISYTGVDQTTPVHASSTLTLTSSSIDPFGVSTYITIDNTWLVGSASEDQGLIAVGPAGTSTTFRATVQHNQQAADSNATVASGSRGLEWERNSPVSGCITGSVMAIAPAAEVAAAAFDDTTFDIIN